MEHLDVNYICTVIGNLSGIPIRLYRDGEQIFFHSIVNLPKDPISLYQKEILSVNTNLGYYITPSFDYYGVVNFNGCKMIMGPTRQIQASEKDLRELAFQLDLLQEGAENFVRAMQSIVAMPFDSVMQMLCVVNHVFNGEKLGLEDVEIYDSDQLALKQRLEDERTEKNFDALAEIQRQQTTHNTLSVEQTVMNMVQKGDSAALREWMNTAPAIRGGILASNELRQLRNIFIVSATLASRSAIRGGMNAEEALSLSDSYIQKCELLSGMTSLTNLQYRMIMDFTERVERIRLGKHPSKLATEVSSYIQRHLSETITTEKIASALFMSRSHLSTKFKAETGVNLNEYVMQEKTEEAKRLLRYSDKSVLAISSYLGFCSQSHFSRVFKKNTGKTPNEYRELHQE
ncbi:MAG: helix-turn-helix domain-containing protein [Christensenellaceae bacterium]